MNTFARYVALALLNPGVAPMRCADFRRFVESLQPDHVYYQSIDGAVRSLGSDRTIKLPADTEPLFVDSGGDLHGYHPEQVIIGKSGRRSEDSFLRYECQGASVFLVGGATTYVGTWLGQPGGPPFTIANCDAYSGVGISPDAETLAWMREPMGIGIMRVARIPKLFQSWQVEEFERSPNISGLGFAVMDRARNDFRFLGPSHVVYVGSLVNPAPLTIDPVVNELRVGSEDTQLGAVKSSEPSHRRRYVFVTRISDGETRIVATLPTPQGRSPFGRNGSGFLTVSADAQSLYVYDQGLIWKLKAADVLNGV